MTGAPAEYDREVNEAVDAHERGQFDEARLHFLRAHAVFPNARTLRGLGKVEFELRNYAQAAQYLEEALSSQVRPLPPDLRNEVQLLLERARSYGGASPGASEPEDTASASASEVVAPGPRLEAMASDPILAAHPLEQERASGTPAYRKWWVWTITGVAVAGAVTGAAVLATREPHVHDSALRLENP